MASCFLDLGTITNYLMVDCLILLNRENLLKKEVSPKVVIRNTLVTTFGLKRNEYSSVFSNVILLDNLFES